MMRSCLSGLAALLVSAGLHAEPHWASLAAPLRSGEVELLGGLGAGVQASTFEEGFTVITPVPAAALGARWGINDTVQVAFPLVATISTDVAGPWPRLSMTAGLTGLGYSSAQGFLAQTVVDVGAHFVGQRQLVVLRVGATGEGAADGIWFAGLGASGGFAYRLDDAWSVGFSAGLGGSQGPSSFPRRSMSAQIGASPALLGNAVPTVRFLVGDVVSVELWTSWTISQVVGDDAFFAGQSATAVVTVTGHF